MPTVRSLTNALTNSPFTGHGEGAMMKKGSFLLLPMVKEKAHVTWDRFSTALGSAASDLTYALVTGE